MWKQRPESLVMGAVIGLLLLTAATGVHAQEPIQHDAEYFILEAQNREAWAADDQAIDKKLAEIRKKNGGQPPNIVYILLDDVGFGEIGMDELSVIRGYKTPQLSAFAKEGLSLQRMYSEPSCTPTRAATAATGFSTCPRGTTTCPTTARTRGNWRSSRSWKSKL